jgi:DNA-directed RNA polymerase subunit L
MGVGYINSKSDHYEVEVKYSTLSTYFDALGEYLSTHNDVKFAMYHGDFFPYADNEDSYWTVSL